MPSNFKVLGLSGLIQFLQQLEETEAGSYLSSHKCEIAKGQAARRPELGVVCLFLTYKLLL